MNNNSNQKIKCEVKSCKFNNEIEYLCTLKEIDVSCTCNKNNCKDKIETKRKIKE